MYFCTQNVIKLRNKTLFSIVFALFWCSILIISGGCHSQRKDAAPIWDDAADSTSADGFDLEQIQANGELIMLTVNGPETYYDFRGREMGAQYMLCQRFADKIGVRLRVEVCRDTTEMVRRLAKGDGDIVACQLRTTDIRMSKDTILMLESCGAGSDSTGYWQVMKDNVQLIDELKGWYSPKLTAEVKKEESFMLSARSVVRHVYAPMLNRATGQISHYDHFFMTYARPIRWDWKLMAAQCYQESTFDPKARSWAGALGLMQIMPATADQLGLPREKIHDPESNIAAAAKFLAQLEAKFGDVPSRYEKQNFALACYNGGYNHIRDAMALAARDGRNSKSWAEVSRYVLRLMEPRYYRDPIVKYGYMRGSETVDYVYRIRKRWQEYTGVKRTAEPLPPSVSSMSPSSSSSHIMPVHDVVSPSIPHPAKKKKKKYTLTMPE